MILAQVQVSGTAGDDHLRTAKYDNVGTAALGCPSGAGPILDRECKSSFARPDSRGRLSPRKPGLRNWAGSGFVSP